MRGKYDMAKWRWQTDLKEGLVPLIIYAVYLLYLFLRMPFYVGSLHPDEGNGFLLASNVYYYFQFFPTVLIVYMSSTIFAESFRRSVREYIVTQPIKTVDIVLKRVLRLFGTLFLLHIPLILLVAGKINTGIDSYIVRFPEYSGFPYIEVFPMLVHIAIGIGFAIASAVFLLSLFKNRYMPVILTIIYCMFECGPLRETFGKYAIFYGAFTPAPVNEMFPVNLIILLILTVIFLFLTTALYRKNAFPTFTGSFHKRK